MTAKQLEEALFEQFDRDLTARRAAAADLNERQRLEEVEHGIDQND